MLQSSNLSPWLHTEFSSVCSCLFCTEEPRTKQNTLQVWPYQHWAEGTGRIICLNLLAPASSNAAQDIPLAFFAARAHCWLMFNLVSPRTSSAFYLLGWMTPSILVYEVVPPQVQDFTLLVLFSKGRYSVLIELQKAVMNRRELF